MQTLKNASLNNTVLMFKLKRCFLKNKKQSLTLAAFWADSERHLPELDFSSVMVAASVPPQARGDNRGVDERPGKPSGTLIKRKMDGHKPSNKAELPEFLCQELREMMQQQREKDQRRAGRDA